MPSLAFGPVEFTLVALDEDQPSAAVLAALSEVLDAGIVRVLDFVVIAKAEDGTITITEVDGDFALGMPGLAGDEDVADVAALIEPGTSAALVAFELLWAKNLAEKLHDSGAEVLSVERIPAPVVNALIDAVDDETDLDD
ncbi:DUF6325 family protein [Microbacterium aurum]